MNDAKVITEYHKHPTHFLRQMIWKPNLIMLSLIFPILYIMYVPLYEINYSRCRSVHITEAKHAGFEDENRCMLEISIDIEGIVCMNGHILGKVCAFSAKLKEFLDENNMSLAGQKVCLYISPDVAYAVVVDVLGQLQAARLKKIALITQEQANPLIEYIVNPVTTQEKLNQLDRR